MYIEKRVKLDNNIYFVRIDIEYKKNKQGFMEIKLINYKDDYYDGGDLSNLIEKIEKQYTQENARCYDNQIGFMADALYIYDRLPILSGIKAVYLSKDNLPYSIDYISRDEIEKYIYDNSINMCNNGSFKLFDEGTWYL